MKTLWILVCFLLSGLAAPAQNTNNVWAFGWGCGIDFNTMPPTPINTSANAYEGCASISDNFGQLLMYTTGDTVYNRYNYPMPNGGNIVGTPVFGSCTQGNLIVPKPGSSTLYYVFTLQGITDGLPQGKLFYNLVDMTLDSGLGDVVAGQKLIQVDAHLGEKMTAVAGTCNNIWVLVCPQSGDELRAYEVTATGISTTPVISPFPIPAPGMYDIGVLKAAHNGKKLIISGYGTAAFQLFDFDNATGVASSPVDFTDSPIASPYSASFSPDDSKLYLLFDSIYQYDISLSTTIAIMSSKVAINSAMVVPGEVCGDMQTAPDGKLYISKLNASTVACIDSPNVAGVACGFIPFAISLPAPAKVGIGLPNSVVNPTSSGSPVTYTHDTTICNTWLAHSSASSGPYTWSSGDTTASIPINQPGTYWVASSAACGIIDTFFVTLLNNNLNLEDISICNWDSISIPISLNASDSASVIWSTGATQSSIVLHDTGIYWVRVMEGSCSASDTMEVKFAPCGCDFFVPTAFSPNNDGLNDLFTPKYSMLDCTGNEQFVLKIFNRWGEEIYSGTKSDGGWDGYYHNRPADVGVYMFYLSYENTEGKHQSQKGDLILLR